MRASGELSLEGDLFDKPTTKVHLNLSVEHASIVGAAGVIGSFARLRNQWQNLSADEQRMLWLAAARFGDEGEHAKKQLGRTLEQVWQIGFEDGPGPTFASLYRDWANNAN